MRRQILFSLSVILLGCVSKKELYVSAEISDNLELEKCYYSVQFDEGQSNIKYEKSFVLELIEPKYEFEDIKYSERELEKYKIDNKTYRLPISESHLKLIFRNEELPTFSKKNNSKGFLFCLIEVLPELKEYSQMELNELDNTIQVKKVKTNSKIIKKIVKHKPEIMLANQYYFESGYYSSRREAVGNSGRGSPYLVKQIKGKLIQLGYELNLDNIMDTKTKEAIIDFQNKRGLPEGQLSYETLIALGIKY